MGLRLVVLCSRYSVAGYLALFICLCLSVVGCGRANYLAGLEKTIKFAKYREKLNLNLAAEWTGKGIRIRVPKQFQLVPGPKPVPEPDEGEEQPDEEPPDPREPEFLRGALPGIVAAWTAVVDIPDPDDPKQSLKVPAYLFVLSNHDMWAQESEGVELNAKGERVQTDALGFNSFAANLIVEGLNVELPADEEWDVEKYPPKHKYVAIKKFIAARLNKATIALKATIPASKSSDNDERTTEPATDPEQRNQPTVSQRDVEVDVDCKIYLAEAKDIRVTVLFIIPEKVESREKLSLDMDDANSSRITMCLETLAVSSKKPPKKQAGERSGGTGF
jgi:hypothetical protein